MLFILYRHYAYLCILCLLNIVFIGAVDTELNHTEGEQDNKMELSYIEKVNKQWFKRIKR